MHQLCHRTKIAQLAGELGNSLVQCRTLRAEIVRFMPHALYFGACSIRGDRVRLTPLAGWAARPDNAPAAPGNRWQGRSAVLKSLAVRGCGSKRDCCHEVAAARRSPVAVRRKSRQPRRHLRQLQLPKLRRQLRYPLPSARPTSPTPRGPLKRSRNFSRRSRSIPIRCCRRC